MLYGGFDGAVHHAGLALTLAKGWKTYWLNPGEGGVPPTIDMKAENLKAITFDCPLPQRYSDQSGDSIGYKDKVVFPFSVTPIDITKPVVGNLSAFFGVCEIVCIPAPVEMPVTLAAAIEPGPNSNEIQLWQMRVPRRRSDGPVLKVSAIDGALVVDLDRPVDDIFVEFRQGPQRFLAAPEAGASAATLKVASKTPASDLVGQLIRIISVSGGTGVEQEMPIV